MIIIKNYGVESEIVREISKNFTDVLAKTFHVDEKEIIFCTERGYLIQGGEDQTDFFAYAEFLYSDDLRIDEVDAARLLSKIYRDFVIHFTVRFTSFHAHDEIKSLNEDYPPYLTGDNMVSWGHHHGEEDDDLDEDSEMRESASLFEGDIFADLDEDLNKRK